MGILKKHGHAVQAEAPAFEAEEGALGVAVKSELAAAPIQDAAIVTAVIQDGALEVAAQPEAQAEVAAEAPKSTAVLARTEGGQLKTFLNSGSGMVSPLVDLENAFQKAGIEVSYSTFPRLRVDAGCIASTEGVEAGEWIELQIVSYSPSWTITPGVDGKEGSQHVRFSDNGETINPAGDNDEFGGMPIEDYRKHLVSLGFEKASTKVYTAVYGLALDCEEAGFAHMNEVVSLNLAPESRKKFDSYKVNRAIQAKMGRIQETSGNPVVRFTSVRVAGKERSYHNLVPTHGKTAPVDLG